MEGLGFIFGIIGMTFGLLGMVYSMSALGKIKALEDRMHRLESTEARLQ